jgi:hypothetical protein
LSLSRDDGALSCLVGVYIKPCYGGTAPGKFRCERSVTAANVQERPACNRDQKFEKQLLLQLVGDPA